MREQNYLEEFILELRKQHKQNIKNNDIAVKALIRTLENLNRDLTKFHGLDNEAKRSMYEKRIEVIHALGLVGGEDALYKLKNILTSKAYIHEEKIAAIEALGIAGSVSPILNI